MDSLWGKEYSREAVAIKRLKEFELAEGYYLAFSGGKDSCVLKHLADKSGVKYDAHYSNTTIDPPDLVRFIKRKHPDVHFEMPKQHFLTRMVVKGFPMRQSRWCCEEYKEGDGEGRFVLLGLRAKESHKRSKRQMVETCTKKNKRMLSPIIDWDEMDVWEYIKANKIPYCKLYDEGWKRLGCVFCPMQTHISRVREARQYPRFTNNFIKAFIKLYNKRKAEGRTSVDRWASGEEMFYWWIGNGKMNATEIKRALKVN